MRVLGHQGRHHRHEHAGCARARRSGGAGQCDRPGLFLTKMVSMLDDKVMASLKEQMEAPALGDVREFAHCCAFIVENAYVNAETIRLDAASRMRAR